MPLHFYVLISELLQHTFAHKKFLLLSSIFHISSALKASRREVLGSIPGCAYRFILSEFVVIFSETRLNTA